MMPLTLSPPLVLADAGDDGAVVGGMASAIPAASAPMAFDFIVSPAIAGTTHDRGAAHPSSPRKHWPGYWPAGGADPWPASGYHMALCSSGGVSQLRLGVRYACLPHEEGPFSIREKASERRSPVLAAAPEHHLDPGSYGTVDRRRRARLDELLPGWRLTCHDHETLRALGLSSSRGGRRRAGRLRRLGHGQPVPARG